MGRSKQRVLPLLLEYLPDPDSYDKYIEPFAGGSNVLPPSTKAFNFE